MKKIRFTIRAAQTAFTPETEIAFAEIAMACGGRCAVRLWMHEYKTQNCVVATFSAGDTAKRLHTLACEFDPTATLTEE